MWAGDIPSSSAAEITGTPACGTGDAMDARAMEASNITIFFI